jgi:hypothetical protein
MTHAAGFVIGAGFSGSVRNAALRHDFPQTGEQTFAALCPDALPQLSDANVLMNKPGTKTGSRLAPPALLAPTAIRTCHYFILEHGGPGSSS